MTWSQKLVLAAIQLAVWIFFSLRIYGAQNVPRQGPAILVANHVNFFDPIFLALASPRWINFMAKEELFRSPLLKPVVHWAQGFSAKRDGSLSDKKETVRQAQEVLERGGILGMFPEGKRSRDGKLQLAKPGAAVLATRMNVPVLPMGVAGTDKLRGATWPFKRPRIVVTVGEPFTLPPTEGKLSRTQMKASTTQLMTHIASLLPSAYRGPYEEHGD